MGKTFFTWCLILVSFSKAQCIQYHLSKPGQDDIILDTFGDIELALVAKGDKTKFKENPELEVALKREFQTLIVKLYLEEPELFDKLNHDKPLTYDEEITAVEYLGSFFEKLAEVSGYTLWYEENE